MYVYSNNIKFILYHLRPNKFYITLNRKVFLRICLEALTCFSNDFDTELAGEAANVIFLKGKSSKFHVNIGYLIYKEFEQKQDGGLKNRTPYLV